MNHLPNHNGRIQAPKTLWVAIDVGKYHIGHVQYPPPIFLDISLMPIYDIPRISLNNLISIDPHQLRQNRYINRYASYSESKGAKQKLCFTSLIPL